MTHPVSTKVTFSASTIVDSGVHRETKGRRQRLRLVPEPRPCPALKQVVIC
jgi:hypothetical protein